MQAKDIPWKNFLQIVSNGEDCFKVLSEYPYKVIMAKYKLSDKKGYTEYGSSINCSWLTEKGIETLIGLGGTYIPPEPFSLSKISEMAKNWGAFK